MELDIDVTEWYNIDKRLLCRRKPFKQEDTGRLGLGEAMCTGSVDAQNLSAQYALRCWQVLI